MQFSANKSSNLRNGERFDQGYYDWLIGSRTTHIQLEAKSPCLD